MDIRFCKYCQMDHPLSSGKTEEDLIRLCHYTNLQLLTAFDNLKKSDKY